MRRTVFARIKSVKRNLICLLLGVLFFNFAVAEGSAFSWDFSDCEIKDILFAVSMDTGISIVPDDTVSGKGDLKFAGSDFDSAFEAFLRSNRLFVRKLNGVWTVSRIRVEREGGVYSLDACDLLPVQIVEKLSEVMDCVVTFDTLPAFRISVHFKELDEALMLQSLAKSFCGYEAVRDSAGYHFVKKNESVRSELVSGSVRIESAGDGRIVVDVTDCRLSLVIEKLFAFGNSIKNSAGIESFCFLADAGGKVQRSVFVGLDFKDTLEKLCAQCGCDFLVSDGIYYIFTKTSARDELLSGKRSWHKFSLRFTKSQDFLTFIFKRLGKLETVQLPDEASFLCLCSENEALVVETLISEADLKKDTYIVNLKYLKPAEFMEHLPPSVDRASLFMADDCERIYFKGTEAAYNNLCQLLELCDRPVKRISYDLLILQYDETAQNAWSSSFGVKKLSAGDRNSASAVLGSVMSFNLNVVTSFGLTFAADLQTSIEENQTRVYADTTLHGISGKEIHFQNTNTYRYRDNNLDPQTGLPIYSGVTKEIASGIKLDVMGWVSGDGMITSKVTASVSRRGNDTSASTGNPPPTSEKIVTTEVCGKSGEPVVLSGLVQTAETGQEKRSPLISKLPLLGNLFKTKNGNYEKSQMVIYLVPHIENHEEIDGEPDSEWIKEKLEKVSQLKNQLVNELKNKRSEVNADEQQI